VGNNNHMSQRYFRADEATYEAVRLQLDSAWGLPANGQESCFAPAARGVRDAGGLVLLAVNNEFATWEPAATVLPQLLASGAVEEIDAETYREASSVPYERP
jgi:hypothetical protein